MKTLKIFSALLFTMIFVCVHTGFAKTSDDHNRPNANPTIQVTYQVVIHFASDKSFCNDYQIEILDGMGMQVAPARFFVPGVTSYKFNESTRQMKGVRIARLVMAPYGVHYICPNELYTAPDIKVIDFKDGNSYQFDLYPKMGSAIKTAK